MFMKFIFPNWVNPLAPGEDTLSLLLDSKSTFLGTEECMFPLHGLGGGWCWCCYFVFCFSLAYHITRRFKGPNNTQCSWKGYVFGKGRVEMLLSCSWKGWQLVEEPARAPG